MEKRRHLASDTGLFAPDVFEVLLNYEIARIQRYPSPLTLLHIALAVEDLGPESRKQSRERMINLLNRSLRISDVPSHYGDEFLVLLPATAEAGGRAVAERLLGVYRTTQTLATGRWLSKLNAYIGLTARNEGGAVTDQELLAEASVAMNEARVRQSYTYIAFSDISANLPKPK
jgi:diguanylate cyclase (GGDEF)-like protein